MDDLTRKVADVLEREIGTHCERCEHELPDLEYAARAIIPIVRADEREACARIGYIVCADLMKQANEIRKRNGNV